MAKEELLEFPGTVSELLPGLSRNYSIVSLKIPSIQYSTSTPGMFPLMLKRQR